MRTRDEVDFVHTGPGTLAGRYLRMFWQPVYRAQDLAPGRAVPVQIMSEPFTLYRGEEGTPHLVAFRCAHRGTQLSVGWIEGECIRCRYHGWKYDASGQCVEQPGEDESFAARVSIRSYPTREYLGLVFAYLGDGDPPPPRRYPAFETEPVLEVYPPDFWPCNYFNRLDNFCDNGHVAYTHRASGLQRNRVSGIGRLSAEETAYGIRSTHAHPAEPASFSQVHMPNTNYLFRTPQGRPGDRLFWRLPVDDGHCVSFCVERTHLVGDAAREYQEQRRSAALGPVVTNHDAGAEVLAGRVRIEDLDVRTSLSGTGYTDFFWAEDYVTQVGQGPIADRSAERLGQTDAGVILLRAVWQRELRALAEGRPLKQWATSVQLEEHVADGAGARR